MKVSIIIPVYDVSAYIERCIKSVMNQTYSSVECIIVDDASQDNSIDKCRNLIREYEGPIIFKILRHKINRGLSAARNTGIEAATGDYIYYLDADDEITTDCIEKLMVPIILDGNIEMVMGYSRRMSNGHTLSPSLWKSVNWKEMDITSNERIRQCYFDERMIYAFAWNKLVKKSFLESHRLFFKEGVIWEDSIWSFYVLKYLSHLYILPYITYMYYNRPDSLTSKTSKTSKTCFKERMRDSGIRYAEIANHLTEGERGREAKFYIWTFCYHYSQDSNNPDFRESAILFKQALAEDNYFLEVILLNLTVLVSTFAIGERICKMGYQVKNFCWSIWEKYFNRR